MAIGDVYQVRIFQRAGSFPDDILNVFYYQQDTGIGGNNAADVAGEFHDIVWDSVRALQYSVYVETRYTVINLMDPADFVEAFPNAPGNHSAAGFSLPSWITVGLRAPRLAAGQRYSYKRISGLQTGNLGVSGRWSDGFQDLINTVAINMGLTLEGANGTYTPVQVAAGWKIGPPLITPTVNYSLLGNWSFNAFPTHQDTRQDSYYEWEQAVTP